MGGKDFPVFIGTVLAVTGLPLKNDQLLSSRKARIQVDESFGGLPAGVREVDVLTGSGGGDCGVPFRPGEKYLVDASVGNDRLLHAGICGITQRIDAAAVAVRLLRQRRDGQRAPSLAGQIAQHDRNFEDTLGMEAPKPLANALVRVKSGGSVYETHADNEGIYEFYDLPSGTYEFAPELPPGTTLSWFIGSDLPQPPFELSAGACAESDIEVFASGSIQGHVFDSSSKLVREAFAYIVPADKNVIPKKRNLYWETQDEEGFFKFVHIPPGEYLIVVNPDDLQNPDFPYRRTFYPAAHDRWSAKIIAVYGGEQIKDVDIRLEQQFTPRHVNVRVKWADGRLIKNWVHIVANGTANPELKSDASTDAKANVGDLKLVPTEPYEVHAELTCRYADERSEGPGAIFRSNDVYVKPDDGQQELDMTVPAMACPDIPGKTLAPDR